MTYQRRRVRPVLRQPHEIRMIDLEQSSPSGSFFREALEYVLSRSTETMLHLSWHRGRRRGSEPIMCAGNGHWLQQG